MKRHIIWIALIAAVLTITSCHCDKVAFHTPKKGFTSWLPAAKWEDALLSGNGTLGAMVMGDPFEETIILNHALLYLPNDAPVIPPDMTSHLDEIRRLSFEGKFQEVAERGVQLWKDAGYGPKKWTDPYVPAADINIDMPASNIADYRRSVNFETAEACVDWKDENGIFSRKTFVSRADGVVVTRIKGNNLINATISIGKHPHSWEQNSFIQSLIKVSETSMLNEGELVFHCEYKKPHESSALGYNSVMKVVIKQGQMETRNDHILVNDAAEILIFTVINPYYQIGEEGLDKLSQTINSIEKDYNYLLARQMDTHGKLYNRMTLNLYPTNEEKEMTSEVLVKSVREETTPGLMQRQFEAARYNILCSTGTNPPNLQGIWSGTWTPPWSSDFTHDGNVAVAVSNLLNGNMPELLNAFFQNHERFLPHYRLNAKQFYGARGIHVPSHTSSHGYNNHYDETWCMEYWNGGAGWTASYFYDYFLYTQDTTFLRERAFPFMSEALLFWEDYLIKGQDGKYVVVPSYSPENNPLEHRWQNSINATMDVVIIKELTRNWINEAKILSIDQSEIIKKEQFLALLPDYQISEDGVLKEWLWPGLTDNQHHRHASHLYSLYEIPDPDLLESPKLMAAAAKTIHERMKIRKQQEGGEMAFGMCHLGNAAVNIGDAETAAEILGYLSRFYWTRGMATTHNPGNLFNMDISGGFPSLMTRMIVNSRPGHLDILPALPDDWSRGEAKGIRARGGIEIEAIQWSPNDVQVDINSMVNQEIELALYKGSDVFDLKVDGADYESKGGIVKLRMKENERMHLSWKLR